MFMNIMTMYLRQSDVVLGDKMTIFYGHYYNGVVHFDMVFGTTL